MAEEKLYSAAEVAELSTRMAAKVKAAMSADGAQTPVKFTVGWRDAIQAAITESAHMVARKAKRELAEESAKIVKLAATVASLEHRLSRQATHLQNLQDRIKRLETL